MSSKKQIKGEDFERELIIAELKKENEKLHAQLKRCRTYCKEALSGETEITDMVFQEQIDQIDTLIGEEETCPTATDLNTNVKKKLTLKKIQ